jgi:hypothetical protein
MDRKSGMNATEFFETWLPETYARIAQEADVTSVADCSLVAEIGDSSWTVSIESSRLHVSRGEVQPPHTFRIRTERDAFERLLAGSLKLAEKQSSTLRVLRLDAETCRLVANVPGALRFKVVDGNLTHEFTFGPGSVDLDAAGCTATVTYDDLAEVQEGRAHPMDLFMNGKLTLDGNIEIAMALGGLFL